MTKQYNLTDLYYDVRKAIEDGHGRKLVYTNGGARVEGLDVRPGEKAARLHVDEEPDCSDVHYQWTCMKCDTVNCESVLGLYGDVICQTCAAHFLYSDVMENDKLPEGYAERLRNKS